MQIPVCGESHHRRSSLVKTNDLYRCDAEGENIPVAAGAEMLSLFVKGHRSSCAVKVADKTADRVILCRFAESYLPPIGQNIRNLRLADGMTQRQLAYHLRVSTQAVSKWERGQAYPDMTLLVPIARLFSVTLDELFGCD